MEKNTPQLSIVVTIYNGAHTLMKCLNSLYAQTLKNYEIICVDDGSTDASLALLKQEAMKNQKVKVIHQSNQGVWFARKAGIREAAGKWIGFVDCDDTVEDCMYQEMVSLGEQEEDIDMVVCGFQKVDAKTDETYARQMTGFGAQVRNCVGGSNRGFLAVVNPSMWNKIYRLDCVHNAIELEKAPRIMEDFIFIASIFPSLRKVSFSGKAFYRYYNWKNSATKTIGYRDVREAEKALVSLKNFWNSRYGDHALLELLVLLHLGIAFTINYNQKGVDSRSIWQETMRFLDLQFPHWRKNQYLAIRYCRQDRMLWKLCLAGHVYPTPVFPIAARAYHFFSERLNIDIKW